MKNLLKTLTLIMLLTFTFGTVNAEELSFQELQQLMVEKHKEEVVSKFEASYNKVYDKFETKLNALTQKNIDKRNWDKAISVYEKAISKVDVVLNKEITVKSSLITSESIKSSVVELKRELYVNLKTLIEEDLQKLKEAKTKAETIRVGKTEKEKEEIKEELLVTANDVSNEDFKKAREEITLNGGKESMLWASVYKTTSGDTFETCAVFYPFDYPEALRRFYGLKSSSQDALDAKEYLDIEYGFWSTQASNTNFNRLIKCIQQNPKDLTKEEYSELYKTLYGKTLTVAPKAWYELTDDYSDLDAFVAQYIK